MDCKWNAMDNLNRFVLFKDIFLNRNLEEQVSKFVFPHIKTRSITCEIQHQDKKVPSQK